MKMEKEKTAAAEKQERAPPPGPEPYPWLVYSYGEGDEDQMLCTISDPNKTYLRTIPELRNKTCLASTSAQSRGWCVYSYSTDWRCLFLWNPSTLEKITLPPLNLKTQVDIKNCLLSSCPRETGCTVILFAANPGLIIYCGNIVDGEWIAFAYFDELQRCIQETEQWSENVRSDEEILLIDPVFCNGNLYAVTSIQDMVVQIHVIQPDSIKIESKVFLTTNTRASHYSHVMSIFLVESCGELFSLDIYYTDSSRRAIAGIVIHRLDFAKMEFLKVKSAKDRAFFFSFNHKYLTFIGCIFSCPATQIEGNRVYFTLSSGGHKNLYSYNIEEGNISVSPPFLNLPRAQSSSIWVMKTDLRLANTFEEKKYKINKEEQGSGKVHGKVDYLKDVEETNDSEAQLLYLPFDMVKLIAERLFLVDYLYFRATCKKFHSVAPPIQWRIAAQGLENPCLSPWLVLFGKEGVYSFIDPKHGDKYLINLPQVLKEENVICSSIDGWLLVTVNLSTFFFNPFTQEIVPIADQHIVRNFSYMGFSSTPSSSECVVVEIEDVSMTQFIVHFCSPGEENWHDFPFDDIDFLFDNNRPVFYKGAFYYLCMNGNLGILKLNDGEPSWKVLTEPKPPCNGNLQKFLVECDGELLSIFVAPFGESVQVFKLNESKMTWIRAENLGNYMIYVSRLSSFSASAKTPGMENKIYFPRLYGESIVFYSLETNNYHTFKSNDVDFYSSTEELYCCWIEPKWC